MDDPFDSAWLKWAQAVVNAEVLERSINDLAGQGELQMRLGLMQEYDAKRHCIILTVGPRETPAVFPIHLGLLLGDIVHNYRSSLDHLAWALYKRGRTPKLSEKLERLVYFPLADTRLKFNGSLKTKLPGVRRADIAIVRRYQPYKTGKRNVYRHALTILDELANADKHRVIQPIQGVPERALYRFVSQTDCVVTRISPRTRRTALKPGAELARFYVRKTGPEPQIDVKPQFTVDPTVNGRTLFQEWGGTTMLYIAQLLSEFAEPPQSVRTLLSTTAHGESPPWLR